jgi:hypothetical protein
MTSILELSARAALCRQLARREPDSENLWLAEAERWSRLAPESRARAMAGQRQPAGTWCWHIPRRRPSDVENTKMQFEFRGAAGRDALEELLSGMSAEAGKPH